MNNIITLYQVQSSAIWDPMFLASYNSYKDGPNSKFPSLIIGKTYTFAFQYNCRCYKVEIEIVREQLIECKEEKDCVHFDVPLRIDEQDTLLSLVLLNTWQPPAPTNIKKIASIMIAGACLYDKSDKKQQTT
jgi:hypothetical protein